MRKYIKVLGMLAIALGVIACKNDELSNNETELYNDVVSSEMEEQDVQADEVVGAHESCDWDSFKGDLPDCAIVTRSGDVYPKTITIDFGAGCETKDGRIKKGKVVIVQSEPMLNLGSKREITFNDFYVNDAKIVGKRDVVNLGKNTNGNIVFLIEGEITATKNNKSRTRVFTRQREWIAGSTTCERSDDEFMITGKATVTVGKRTITREIIEPIHVAPGSCKYPKSGKLFIDRGRKEGTIDFGDGTCDNLAVLTTSKGKVKQIDLDQRRCKN